MEELNELKRELNSLKTALNKHKDDAESNRNEQIIDNEAREIVIAELKTSLEATQTSVEAAHALNLKQKSEIDQLRMERKNDLCKIKSLNDQVELLRKQLESDHHRLVYVEDSSRRSSLRFRGVPEQPWETWEQCQARILRILKEKMDISPEIERAHRIGKRERGIIREVIVKFLRFPDKEYIFNNRHRLSSSGIFVKEDFSNDTAELRRSFQGDIREARERGLIAYAKYRSLVVHPPRSDGAHAGPHRGGRGRGRGGANRGARGGQGDRGARGGTSNARGGYGSRGTRGGTGAESASEARAGHSATPMTLQQAIIGQPAVLLQPPAPEQMEASDPAAPEQLAASEPAAPKQLAASRPAAPEQLVAPEPAAPEKLAASGPAAPEQLAASGPAAPEQRAVPESPAPVQPATVEHLDSPESNERSTQVSQNTRSRTADTNRRSERKEPEKDIFSGFSSSDSDNVTSATVATAIRLAKRRAPEPSSASPSPSPSKKQERKKKRENGKEGKTSQSRRDSFPDMD